MLSGTTSAAVAWEFACPLNGPIFFLGGCRDGLRGFQRFAAIRNKVRDASPQLPQSRDWGPANVIVIGDPQQVVKTVTVEPTE